MPVTAFPAPREYREIAAELLGRDPAQIEDLPGIARVETALAAARFGCGGHDARLSLTDAGALLVERLARARPLPDGNRRAAFLSLWLFMAANGRPFRGVDPAGDVPMIERCAAGRATITEIAQWLERRTAHR